MNLQEQTQGKLFGSLTSFCEVLFELPHVISSIKMTCVQVHLLKPEHFRNGACADRFCLFHLEFSAAEFFIILRR